MWREAPKKLFSSNEGNTGEPRSKTCRMGGNLQNVGWLSDVGIKKLFPGMWYKLIWTLLWKCLALLLLLAIYTYDHKHEHNHVRRRNERNNSDITIFRTLSLIYMLVTMFFYVIHNSCIYPDLAHPYPQLNTKL